MKKALALDLGDKWVGIAISDTLKMFARPYKTVTAPELEHALITILKEEPVDTVVVGYPKTMKGRESDQTTKVVQQKEDLEKKFSSVAWVLWDERLSSQRADSVSSTKKNKKKTPEEKLKSHSVAAAFILDSYLTAQSFI
jgi:putative Holliday junction resolvase